MKMLRNFLHHPVDSASFFLVGPPCFMFFPSGDRPSSALRLVYRQINTGGFTQGVPGGKVDILGSHSIGHSEQKCLYKHVSYSERFSR